MSRGRLSDGERESVQADLDRARKAMEGATLSLSSETPAKKPCLYWREK